MHPPGIQNATKKQEVQLLSDLTEIIQKMHYRGEPRNFDQMLNLAYRVVNTQTTPIESFTQILELIFDISVLQERIASRSPAFEGIRIVKERVKS
jgi:hypothetical protein